jgi:hypothetical protein
VSRPITFEIAGVREVQNHSDAFWPCWSNPSERLLEKKLRIDRLSRSPSR